MTDKLPDAVQPTDKTIPATANTRAVGVMGLDLQEGGHRSAKAGIRVGILGLVTRCRRHVQPRAFIKRTTEMMKMSDICILLAVMVSFTISAYLWFNGQKNEGLFTATWVPSILCFGIYFKVLSLKGRTHD